MIEPTHWKLVSNLRLTAGGQAFFLLQEKKIKNVSPLAAAYLGDVAVSNRALKSLPLFLTTYFSRVSKKFSICNEEGHGTLGTLGTAGTPRDTMNTWTLGTSGTPRTPRQKESPGTASRRHQGLQKTPGSLDTGQYF